MTIESTLLYTGIVVEWLLTMQELSNRAVLLAGRWDAAMPPLLVAAAEAKSVDGVDNSSSPSSTMRSSPNSHTSDVCVQHTTNV